MVKAIKKENSLPELFEGTTIELDDTNIKDIAKSVKKRGKVHVKSFGKYSEVGLVICDMIELINFLMTKAYPDTSMEIDQGSLKQSTEASALSVEVEGAEKPTEPIPIDLININSRRRGIDTQKMPRYKKRRMGEQLDCSISSNVRNDDGNKSAETRLSSADANIVNVANIIEPPSLIPTPHHFTAQQSDKQTTNTATTIADLLISATNQTSEPLNSIPAQSLSANNQSNDLAPPSKKINRNEAEQSRERFSSSKTTHRNEATDKRPSNNNRRDRREERSAKSRRDDPGVFNNRSKTDSWRSKRRNHPTSREEPDMDKRDYHASSHRSETSSRKSERRPPVPRNYNYLRDKVDKRDSQRSLSRWENQQSNKYAFFNHEPVVGAGLTSSYSSGQYKQTRPTIVPSNKSTPLPIRSTYPGIKPMDRRPKVELDVEPSSSLPWHMPDITVPPPPFPPGYAPMTHQNGPTISQQNDSKQALQRGSTSSTSNTDQNSSKQHQTGPEPSLGIFVENNLNQASEFNPKVKRRIAHARSVDQQQQQPLPAKRTVIQQQSREPSPSSSPHSSISTLAPADIGYFGRMVSLLNATKNPGERKTIWDELHSSGNFAKFLQFKARYNNY